VAFPIFGGEGAIDRARKHRVEGKYDRAIRLLEKELKKGEHFALLAELGSVYFENGQRKEAASVFKRAAAADPHQLELLLGVVEDLHYRGEQPPETGEFLLETYIGRRDFENAHRTLRALDPQDMEPLESRYRQMHENISKYKGDREKRTKDLIVHYCLALLAVEKKDLETAFGLFRDVVEISPEEIQPVIVECHEIARANYGDHRPCLVLGDLYAQSGQASSAVREFRKAVEFDRAALEQATNALEAIGPASAESLKALLEFYVAGGRFQDATRLVAESLDAGTISTDDAIKSYREIVRLDASQVNVFLSLGDAYLSKGQIETALSEYSRVLEVAPGSKAEVLDRYRAVFERDPAHSLTLSYLVDALLDSGEFAEAAQYLKMAYEADRGMAQEIVPRLYRVLEARTDDVETLDLVGRIFSDKGEIERAIAVFEHQADCGEEGLERAKAGIERVYEQAGKEWQVKVCLAGILRRTGDWARAIELLAEAAEDAPKRVTSILPHIDLLARTEEKSLPRVIALYERVRDLGADEFLATLALGETYGMAGKYAEMMEELLRCHRIDPGQTEEVIGAYERVLARNPKAVDAQMGLAELLLEAGNVQEAAGHYEMVLASDPHRFDQVVARLQTILEADEKNIAIRKALVDAYRDRGLFDQVIQEAKRALDVVPEEESAYFHLRLGEGMAERGNLSQSGGPILGAVQLDRSLADEATGILRKVLEIDKHNIPAHYVLGKIYGVAGDVPHAVEEFMTIGKIAPDRRTRVVEELSTLIGVDPASADAHYARGVVLSSLDRAEEAVADLEQAMEIDEAYVDRVIARINSIIQDRGEEARLLLALGRAQIKKGYDGQAVPILSKALALDSGLHETVVRELHRIIERSPRNVDARFRLADCHVARGNFNQAVEILQETGEMDPRSRDRRISALEKILSAQESSVPCHHALVQAYVQDGEFQKAVRHSVRIVELDPDELGSVVERLAEMAEQSGKLPVVLDALTSMLIEKGDLETATARLAELAERDETAVEVVMDRLRRIIRLDATQTDASYALGDLLLARGEVESARDVLAPVLDAEQDRDLRARIHLGLSHSLYRLGSLEEARKEAQQAAQEASDQNAVCREFERLHTRSVQLELERTMRRLEADPESEELRIVAARQLRGAGRLDEAEQLLMFRGRTGRLERMRACEVARCLMERHYYCGAAEVLMATDVGDGAEGREADETSREVFHQLALACEKMGDRLGTVAALGRLMEGGVPYRDAKRRLERAYTRLVADELEGRGKVLEGIIRGGRAPVPASHVTEQTVS